MNTKKKIVLAAGVYPPQIGGPAKYAKNMADELEKLGYEVSIATYIFEHKLPPVIRHLWYFCKLLPKLIGSEVVIGFDTLSTGVPAALAAKLLGKKCIIRIGGDFLWETHVEATGDTTPLPKIYDHKDTWPKRNKIVYALTNFLFKIGDEFVFNSDWQRQLFLKNYKLTESKTHVVKNVFEGGKPAEQFLKKNFVWAGRPIKLKNIENFKKAFEEAKEEAPDIELEVITDMPHKELMEKVSSCYAIALPSYSDVAPNLVIEGIERGKPFVCTKYTSLVSDFGSCGVFVDPEDVSDMRRGILEIATKSIYEEKALSAKSLSYKHSFKDITGEFLKIAGI